MQKIYGAYIEYDVCVQYGRDSYNDGKKRIYQGFYENEINCLRDCVENGWKCEEIEFKDDQKSNPCL